MMMIAMPLASRMPKLAGCGWGEGVGTAEILAVP